MGKKMLAIVILAIMWLTTSALAQQKDFTLTKEGVGAIKLGMRFDQIPAKCEGLYTHFKKTVTEDEMDGDCTEYTFYYGDSVVMYTSYYDGQTTIGHISSVSPRIKATNGMHAGMPAIELYNRKAKANCEAPGCFTVGEYVFGAPLSTSGEKKSSNAYETGKVKAIAPSDFPKGAKIGSMSIDIY